MKKNLIYLFAVCLTLVFTAQFGSAQGRVLQIINERYEIPYAALDDCNQMETLTGSGFDHFVGRVYLDKAGLFHLDYNDNRHFTVTGDITGVQSVVNETIRQQGIITSLDSCGVSQDIVYKQRIISRGPLQNDFYTSRFHVDVDPETCFVTISPPTVSFECRGR